MKYTVLLSSEAVKALNRIDWLLEHRIRERLRNLENKPEIQGETIKRMNGLRLQRLDDWHILYTVYEKKRVVYVLAIRPIGQ